MDGPIERSPDLTEHPNVERVRDAYTFEPTGGTQKLEIPGIFADDRHAVVVVHETASRPDGATLDVDEVSICWRWTLMVESRTGGTCRTTLRHTILFFDGL